MTKNIPHAIEVWEIEKVIPYEKNAKKHPEEQVKKLAKAIEKFGWTQPIVVWTNGEIIAGHGRRLAAIELGYKKVPVIVRSDLSKAEADALRLSDNRVTSTEYDLESIQDELRRLSIELETSEIDLSDLGFDEKELNFSLSDLGAMNSDFFVEDLASEVEDQKDSNLSAMEKTDETAAPVTDALGFKRVTISQSRSIRNYMTTIETRTGLVGADALIDFLAEQLD